MLTDMDRMVRLNDSGLSFEFSVLSLGTGDTFSNLDILEGDVFGACACDVGILDDDEGWLCLLSSTRLGHSGDNSVVSG